MKWVMLVYEDRAQGSVSAVRVKDSIKQKVEKASLADWRPVMRRSLNECHV